MRIGTTGWFFQRDGRKTLGVLALSAFAPAIAAASTPERGAWMPDVERRVEELRQRTLDAAMEERERRGRTADAGEEWRRTAARPRSGRPAPAKQPTENAR